MSVSDEINSLRTRAEIISKRGSRLHRLIVYAEGLNAKIDQAEFALTQLTSFINDTGYTVTATTPEGFVPSSELYFYGDAFWTFLYSSLDVLAQVVNQALKLDIDEENVTFGRLAIELKQHSSYADTPIYNRVHNCKVSRWYHWLKKYRNCSVHRRRVYIGRQVFDVGTPEYHLASSTETIGVGAFNAGPFTLCDDPYTIKPKTDKRRTIPDYMRQTKEVILDHIVIILKSTYPVR